MPRLRDLQAEFATAIKNPDRPVPEAIMEQNGCRSNKRFAVYRNNVHVSLIEALRTQFPVIDRLVGEDFFRSLAHAYVSENLPSSPLMFRYGETFPDFLESFDKVEELPYLADVARLEFARTQSFHETDKAPLSLQDLAKIPQESFPHAQFDLHPSLRVVNSQYPILTIWRANTGDLEVDEIFFDKGGEDVLVVRPALSVNVYTLAPGTTDFLKALEEKKPITDAVETAIERVPEFEFSALLPDLANAGIFTNYHLNET